MARLVRAVLEFNTSQIHLGGLGERCELQLREPQMHFDSSTGLKMHLVAATFNFPLNISYDAKCVIPPRFRRSYPFPLPFCPVYSL